MEIVCGTGTVIRAPTSDVNVSFPVNGTWLLSGDTTRISGNVNTTEVDYSKVEIYLERRYAPNWQGVPEMILNWTEASGPVDNWFLDVLIEDSWVEYTDNPTMTSFECMLELQARKEMSQILQSVT